ncbi:hypothetical protein WJX84_008862 [Apatococcus fuscideae]|uniref:VWFA domain-containing protein n=1 Tax=Apatococcus fuscideae TaxID=2026836 RepID=A0AAW1TBR1_9CHLO
MPWLLRLAHTRARVTGTDSQAALRSSAEGLRTWKMALERGLLPDDDTLQQLGRELRSPFAGRLVEELQWPSEPLRSVLIRSISQLGAAHFAKKYPAVLAALLKSILELTCDYHRTLAGEPKGGQPEVSETGDVFMTVAELIKQEERRRAVRANRLGQGQATAAPAEEQESEPDPQEAIRAAWSPERRVAEDLVAAMIQAWQAPILTLSRAGRAFEGLEGLLGGFFDLTGNLWRRKGWERMDEMRARLEDLRELRDLVRSLGRGGGWGPLRRAPIQYLDMKGRPGLLRTVLEAQETRGLTRSDDISRLLPSESATLARGRKQRAAKLLFYSKVVEKSLQTYERDGWSEFPTQIVPERREVRPTADRGPILLCVDTSGSMRGARETVAKALALECMRAAKAQERGCYAFCFSGPQEVREVQLNQDLDSINNLLDFLESRFNGGSDFNEPIRRCLARLSDAKWANSDILLVSDGELRQPGQEVMRKLAGAKDKLSLRVHSLIVGSPEKKRADPAVLRALCSHVLPSGKLEVLVSEFSSWASVGQDQAMQFDWDDAIGNASRRAAGLKLEAYRQAEIKRKRKEAAIAKREAKAAAKLA